MNSITTMLKNLMKSFVISFRHGINVPKYEFNVSNENNLGIKKRASIESMSNDMSMILELCCDSPMILEKRKATPIPIIAMSQRLQKSAA